MPSRPTHVATAQDYSGCYYEGDRPDLVMQFFSSLAAAEEWKKKNNYKNRIMEVQITEIPNAI